MPKLIKQRPAPLQISAKSAKSATNKKRKFDEIDSGDASDASDSGDASNDEENNMLHPLRQTDVYKILTLFKKTKIDKTIFAPRIVSGIIFPTLPKGFTRIPDYDYDSLSDYDADFEDDTQQDNLLMLVEVITNLEKL
jgi:hypothetical protein